MPDKLVTPSSGLSNSDLAKANAGTGDVIAGKTFYAGDKNLKAGTMVNRGAWGTTINPGGSVTIPQGWHNGSGVVRSNPATYNGSGTIKWCPTGRVAYSPDDSSVYIEVTGYSGNAIHYRWSAHNFGIRFNLVVIV